MIYSYVESLDSVIQIERDHDRLRFDIDATFSDGIVIDIYVGF